MTRLKKKYETARSLGSKAGDEHSRDAKIGIIAYGSTHPAVEEALALLRRAGDQNLLPSFACAASIRRK